MGSRRLDRILKHSRVALDTNIFIYALENNREFAIVGKLMTKLARSSVKIFTSVLSILEATVPLYKLGDQRQVLEYVQFVNGNGRITVAEVDQVIALKAAQLRAKHWLTTPDAIHLATALINKAELFVTADSRLGGKKVGRLRVEILAPSRG